MSTIYTCEFCADFKPTDRKSSFEKHLKSSKHQRNCNKSVCSFAEDDNATCITTDTTTTAVTNEMCANATSATTDDAMRRIIELECQLRMKDMEIQAIVDRNHMEMKMKDMEIKHLTEQLEQQQQQSGVGSESRIKRARPTKPRYEVIMEERKNAITIEELTCRFRNPKYNPYLVRAENSNINLLKYIHPCDYTKDAMIKVITGMLSTMKKNESPIFCTDEGEHHYYMNSSTIGGWVSFNYCDGLAIEDFIDQLKKYVFDAFFEAYGNTVSNEQLFTEIHKTNFERWGGISNRPKNTCVLAELQELHDASQHEVVMAADDETGGIEPQLIVGKLYELQHELEHHLKPKLSKVTFTK